MIFLLPFAFLFWRGMTLQHLQQRARVAIFAALGMTSGATRGMTHRRELSLAGHRRTGFDRRRIEPGLTGPGLTGQHFA
jgi:hypothetical protein